MNYQVRITHPDLEHIIVALSQVAAQGNCTDWIVYQHEKDEKVSRSHFHIYYFNWCYKEDTFRTRFAEAFPHLPKADFSISARAGRRKGVITLEGAVKYGSKYGAKSAVVVRGFDIEHIKKLEQQEVSNRIVYVMNESTSKEPRQRTKWDLLQKMLYQYDEFKKDNHRNPHKADIIKIITETLTEYKQVSSLFKIQEFYYSIKMYRQGIDFEEWVEKNIKD